MKGKDQKKAAAHLLHAECDLASLEACGAPRHIVAGVELQRKKTQWMRRAETGVSSTQFGPIPSYLLQGLRQVLVEFLFSLAQLLNVPLQVFHCGLHL